MVSGGFEPLTIRALAVVWMVVPNSDICESIAKIANGWDFRQTYHEPQKFQARIAKSILRIPAE
jgi:hypothetical protein